VRRTIFVLVGAITFGAATFFGGLTLFQNWDGSLKELAIWLVVVGTIAGALLGLLAERLLRPSVKRGIRLLVLGSVAGLLMGLVFGMVVLEEACVMEPGGVDPGPCGWVFWGWLFNNFQIPIALWASFGAVLGGILAWIAARFTPEMGATLPAITGLD
jgi:hypothetical protein